MVNDYSIPVLRNMSEEELTRAVEDSGVTIEEARIVLAKHIIVNVDAARNRLEEARIVAGKAAYKEGYRDGYQDCARRTGRS